ncbi:ankyrin repeat-containing domain protein [Aspergillus karnatakaensis]|uniref:ankyrin repeat domain-containing protein n=1 Tax=Aspergillus karnatakaensis TaxID=1810916 RepID=UPI003CCCB21C
MLLQLPLELARAIWYELDSYADKATLILTCRRFQQAFNTDFYRSLTQSEYESDMALVWAASHGNEACMRNLLAHGLNPKTNECFDITKYTNFENHIFPRVDDHVEYHELMSSSIVACAARLGHLGMVKLLIDAGANINCHGGNGDFPLICAVGQGHVGVVSLLLDAGACANLEIGGTGTLLVYASSRGFLDVVELLLKKRDLPT